MKENTDQPKSLTFVATTHVEDANFAGAHFNEEAKKLDVFWSSSILILPSANALSALQSSDAVILLQGSDDGNILKSHAPNWSGKFETWHLTAGDDVKSLIEKSIGTLLIKLILQGGKRTPFTPAAPSKAVTSDSNNASGGKTNVRVMRESKGRKGKTVTVISGLGMDDGQLLDLAASLKQLCGTGGTVKDGKIEIQGDQCDRVLAALLDKGFKAKRAGG